MATVADRIPGGRGDYRRPSERAFVKMIDRWIYVFVAAAFVVITLIGFIPDSVGQLAAIKAGARPPFPWVAHVHAVLMGSFLLLLLAQTTLVATDRRGPGLQQLRLILDNIMLFQLQIGFLFPVLVMIGLGARRGNPGLHKRMMILAPAMALPAAIDRMHWLPTTLPASPLATDLYLLLVISPLFIWDLVRSRQVHPAYLIWLALFLPLTIAVYMLWGTAWWHAMGPRVMGL